jgi:hypothetical protein
MHIMSQFIVREPFHAKSLRNLNPGFVRDSGGVAHIRKVQDDQSQENVTQPKMPDEGAAQDHSKVSFPCLPGSVQQGFSEQISGKHEL